MDDQVPGVGVACHVLLPHLGVAGEHDVEPHPPAFYDYGGLY
jgi:hypothetical protein